METIYDNAGTATEQQQESTQQGASSGAEETTGKTFTQEEVNGFVQTRLSRARAQYEKEVNAANEARTLELDKREMKLLAKELLMDSGLPKDMAELVTGNSKEEIESKIDLLKKYQGSSQPTATHGFQQIGAGKTDERATADDMIRKAMGIK